MDQSEALNIAKKYAKELRLKYDYKQIILFGSFAKGNFHEYSDIDLAIVLKDFNNLIETQVDLMRLSRKIDTRIEPHPYRERDFIIDNPVVSEILTHGKRIEA